MKWPNPFRQRSPLGRNGCPMVLSRNPNHELWCSRPRDHSDGHVYAVTRKTSRWHRLIWHPAALPASLAVGVLIGVLVTLVTWALGNQMWWS